MKKNVNLESNLRGLLKTNLRFFSEGDDGSGDGGNQGGEQGEQKSEQQEKTYTQAELDKAIQSEADKRVESALSNYKKDQSAEVAKLLEDAKKQALTEAEKVAQMSAEQKLEHERQKREEELAKRESALNRRELGVKAKELLTEKGLPASFEALVNFDDAEKCVGSINEIEKAFKEELAKGIEKGINERLRADPPGDSTANTSDAFISALNV